MTDITKRGGLDRCQLGSGKVLWLCKKHQKRGNGRVTLLPVDASGGSERNLPSLVFEGDHRMREVLETLLPQMTELHRQEYLAAVAAEQAWLNTKAGSKMAVTNEDKAKPRLQRRATSDLLIQGAVTIAKGTSDRPLRPKTGVKNSAPIPEKNENDAPAAQPTTTTVQPLPTLRRPVRPSSAQPRPAVPVNKSGAKVQPQTAESKACVLL